MSGQNALTGALHRTENRPTCNSPASAFVARVEPPTASTGDVQAHNNWDNYDDHNNFPDAPLPSD